jgi:hypothetical protein
LKLEEAARKAIELLREAGDNGINNLELAQKLKVPRRRVYDIVNPLKPLGLIEIRKEKGKTKIFWSGKKEAVIKPEKKEPPEKERKSLKIETVKLIEDRQLLESFVGDQGEEVFKFNCKALRIGCATPPKTCRVYHDGLEVVVETDGEGLVVKPDSLKPRTPKVKTVF